jgi:hypothetical protein
VSTDPDFSASKKKGLFFLFFIINRVPYWAASLLDAARGAVEKEREREKKFNEVS